MFSLVIQLLSQLSLQRILVPLHGRAPVVNINDLHQHIGVLFVFGIYPCIKSIYFCSHLGNLALDDCVLSGQLHNQLFTLGQAVLIPFLVLLEELLLLLHTFAKVFIFLVNFLHLFHEVAKQPIVLASNLVNVILQLVQILIKSTLNLVGLVLESL